LQCYGLEKAGVAQAFGFIEAGGERLVDLPWRERADVDCHPSLSEIALRIPCTRWRTPNCWVTRKIDGIRDQGGRRISYGGRGREHRDSVGDAKREAAAAPARRR
jgi:hypothetical protein